MRVARRICKGVALRAGRSGGGTLNVSPFSGGGTFFGLGGGIFAAPLLLDYRAARRVVCGGAGPTALGPGVRLRLAKRSLRRRRVGGVTARGWGPK
jgi:hypothetical protein